MIFFQILAEEAHSVDSLDANACRDILTKAQSDFTSATSEQVFQLLTLKGKYRG